MSNISKTILSNGTTVLVDSEPHFASIGCTVCVLGGLRDEAEASIGITHVLEHLLFKRTKTKDTQTLACSIDDLGGDVNAFTDSDSFCVHGTVSKDRFNDLFSLLAELLLEVKFNSTELELEKEVIRQEIIESEDDPGDATYQCFTESFWPGSILGKPVFGSKENVKRFTCADLEERLSFLLKGKRIIVAVAGAVEQQEVVKLSEEFFGKLSEGEPPQRQIPKTAAGFEMILRPVNQTYITIGKPWPSITGDNYLCGLILATVLGGGMSSRLFQLLREQKGYTYDIDADVDDYGDVAALVISSNMEKKHINEALKLIFCEIEKLRLENITDEEYGRTLRMINAHALMERDSLSSRLWRLVESEMNFGRYISTDEIRKKLEALSLEQIDDFRKIWLSKDDFFIVLGGDVEDISIGEDIKRYCQRG